MPKLSARVVDDLADLGALAGRHDPAAILISGAVAEPALAGRVRAWAVGPPGEELGVAAAIEVTPGRWTASVLCLDPRAAPVLARVLVASPARWLSGTAAHVEPVLAQWPGSTALRLPLRSSNHEEVVRFPEHDPRIRPAGPGDVAALVRLYGSSDLELLGPALGEAVERLVADHRVVLAEVGGELVGAIRCELRSPRYDWWSGLWVAPEHRRTGLATALHRRAGEVSVALGRRAVGAAAPSNHMVPRHQPAEDVWLEAAVPAPPPSWRARARRKARRTWRRTGGRRVLRSPR
ncbi:GNAT family N-acetyltransferase [Aquihabitans sp. G128]|uniref:GNAT family N-acetyltransferase n=1 Tax=Aquihabitans sp. G128 TaxID=2849779 RepID=UPI001C24520F|nr:GNAT family N-acetyltransferase [Aquihabitans sp. G128]QXC63561.1 GNAT family N-acetyltransferase [Aquihabitans sp. G128]